MKQLAQRSRRLAGERRLLASVLRREGLYRRHPIGIVLGVGPEQAGLSARAGDDLPSDLRCRRLLAAFSGTYTTDYGLTPSPAFAYRQSPDRMRSLAASVR